jgi:HAD superfamily hydrolase (TIGR01549 family)
LKNSTANQHRLETQKEITPAVLFDLDGTLVDSAYDHVIAWRDALREEGIHIPNARIHRYVGMSGKLMLRVLFTEMWRKASPGKIEQLEKLHLKNFQKRLSAIDVLPGARELLKYLSAIGIQWAIATSGERQSMAKMIQPLRVPAGIPVITGDDVDKAKPHPDVFFAAATRLGMALCDCIVVGDSTWDLLAARRAKALGIGLLCGGYGEAELVQAGAYRVYKNPADLLDHIGEIGLQHE